MRFKGLFLMEERDVKYTIVFEGSAEQRKNMFFVANGIENPNLLQEAWANMRVARPGQVQFNFGASEERQKEVAIRLLKAGDYIYSTEFEENDAWEPTLLVRSLAHNQSSFDVG